MRNELEEKIISNEKIRKIYQTKFPIKIIFILFIISILIFSYYKVENNNINITNIDQFIDKLNKDSYKRNPKYILFFDYLDSDVCPDKNAYLVFKYYLEHNFNDAYYVINDQTQLYKELLIKNETKK